MNIKLHTRLQYLRSMGGTLLICGIIVAVAALLGRITLNLKAALVDKPDLGIYELYPEATDAHLLRAGQTQRDYLLDTPAGPKLVKLTKVSGQWIMSLVEALHE